MTALKHSPGSLIDTSLLLDLSLAHPLLHLSGPMGLQMLHLSLKPFSAALDHFPYLALSMPTIAISSAFSEEVRLTLVPLSLQREEVITQKANSGEQG